MPQFFFLGLSHHRSVDSQAIHQSAYIEAPFTRLNKNCLLFLLLLILRSFLPPCFSSTPCELAPLLRSHVFACLSGRFRCYASDLRTLLRRSVFGSFEATQSTKCDCGRVFLFCHDKPDDTTSLAERVHRPTVPCAVRIFSLASVPVRMQYRTVPKSTRADRVQLHPTGPDHHDLLRRTQWLRPHYQTSIPSLEVSSASCALDADALSDSRSAAGALRNRHRARATAATRVNHSQRFTILKTIRRTASTTFCIGTVSDERPGKSHRSLRAGKHLKR